MKALTLLATLLRRCAPLAVVAATTAVLGGGSPAHAQANCYPECGPGQVCVQGTCMVPAPPAGYPAPAQGYPQGAPPPAPAYPPPQGSYPPPQGNYYGPPPQGGAYPGSGSGAYPAPPPQAYSQRRGFLAIPFLGLHSYQGDVAEGVEAGFRLGVLLGGHLNERLSLNGELGLDFVNPKVNDELNTVDVVIAFSPLVHVPLGGADLAVGPKLGIRRLAISGTINDPVLGVGDYDASMSGFVLGLNAGVFVPVSDSVSLGGLLTFEVRGNREFCASSPVAPQESCSTDEFYTGGSSDKVLGITGAALF